MYKKIAAILGKSMTAEILSVFSVFVAVYGFSTSLYLTVLALLMAFLSFFPLAIYGRERYCITGLLIFIFSLATWVIGGIKIFTTVLG